MSGYEEAARLAPEIPPEMLPFSLEAAAFGEKIVADPGRYGASEHLGKTCVVWTVQAYPHKYNQELSSLMDVKGAVVGADGSVDLENHRAWNSVGDSREAPRYTRKKHDCSELVRASDGTSQGYHLYDDGGERSGVKPSKDLKDGVGPHLDAYFGLSGDLGRLVAAVDTPDVLSSQPNRIIVGAEAAYWARRIMPHRHQFRHPALRAWYDDQNRRTAA